MIEPFLPEPRGEFAGQFGHRGLRVIAHPLAEHGEREALVPRIIGIVLQRHHALVDHLRDRGVDRLTRHPESSRDIRRAGDPADDIDHHHRLRPADIGPAALVNARL